MIYKCNSGAKLTIHAGHVPPQRNLRFKVKPHPTYTSWKQVGLWAQKCLQSPHHGQQCELMAGRVGWIHGFLFVCLFAGVGMGSGSDIYLYPQGIHLKTFKMSKFTVLSKNMKATESKNNTSLTVLTGTELNWNRTSGFPWGQCLNQWREQGEKVLERCVTPSPRPSFPGTILEPAHVTPN